ncbi:MAG: tetratricopeptide repeat protein [Desulfarculaceae bacterium]|jgi:tetratricopeptide (TPR) repeat protein
MWLKRLFWRIITGSKFKALMLEGQSLLRAGRYAEALETYREAVQEKPAEPNVYMGFARVYKGLGLRPESLREQGIADALLALQKNPDNIQARRTLAQNFLDKGRNNWAEDHIEYALELDSLNTEILLLGAQIFRATRNFTRAAQVLDQYLRQKPLEVEPYEQLAHCLKAARSFKAAANAASKADALRAVAQDSDNPEVVMRAIQLFVGSGQSGVARALVERCLKSHPESGSLHRLLGELVLEKEHDHKQALPFLRKAVEIDPLDLKAHRTLAKVYELDGLKDEAQEHLKLVNALEKASSDTDPITQEMAKIQLLSDSGRPDLALARCEALLRDHPQDWRGPFLKGFLLRSQGDLKQAQELLNQALGLDATAPEPRLELARLHSQTGDVLEAIGQARKAVAVAQHQPKVRLELAKILRAHGYTSQAVEEEELAESIARDNKKK